MHKLTARSAKWMETVKANFAEATGKTVEAWAKRARARTEWTATSRRRADVMIAPRKSQVTFARHVTFAVVRAATNDRVHLLLRLAGQKPTSRLVANPRAAGSDPTHVVALSSAKDVDAGVKEWLALAYERAART